MYVATDKNFLEIGFRILST